MREPAGRFPLRALVRERRDTDRRKEGSSISGPRSEECSSLGIPRASASILKARIR